jgi:hypothetical protein
MDKCHFGVFFIPGIAACRTTVGAGTLITGLTDFRVELYMRITVYIKTGIIKNLIWIDIHSALHPL